MVQDKHLQLQRQTNIKSYNIMIYRSPPFSMILNDPNPDCNKLRAMACQLFSI